MTDRFMRTEMLFGAEAMARLRAARVTVVGLGAVGSYAVEGLARAGVGRLRLVDFDVVQRSNINRQLLALESTLGRPKCVVARERVLDINPDCQVEALNLFCHDETMSEVLNPRPDVVIDAIDSLNPKVGLIAAAVRAGLPIVSSMGAANRADPLGVRIADLDATRGCPLARFVRKRVRRRGVEGPVRCVYSEEPPRRHAADAPAVTELDAWRPAGKDGGRRRPPLASASYLTGIFGLTAGAEAVRLILAGTHPPCGIR